MSTATGIEAPSGDLGAQAAQVALVVGVAGGRRLSPAVRREVEAGVVEALAAGWGLGEAALEAVRSAARLAGSRYVEAARVCDLLCYLAAHGPEAPEVLAGMGALAGGLAGRNLVAPEELDELAGALGRARGR